MHKYILLALVMCGMVCHHGAAQTVRFSTGVGEFDMVLNPTNDPNLQPLVDNLIAYVGLGRYHNVAINRAADGTAGDPSDDFVMQLGGFLAFPNAPELFAANPIAVRDLEAVTVDANGDGDVDFNTISNTRGTVSLALSAGNPNSGRSSFFVNLGNNQFLDGQGFVPFARIDNMDTVDRIMELQQVDVSADAGRPGDLTFIDVPLLDNGKIATITNVEVVESNDDFSFVGPIATALQIANRAITSEPSTLATMAALSSSAAIEPPLSSGMVDTITVSTDVYPVEAIGVSVVPEPSTAWLAVVGCLAWWRRRRS
ncbi:MAG: peptidylprolyl isomerase [Planctomycetales bacterium]|nr:peptidylprolyl isomerase [Planctomycetales bacterium]